MKKTCAICGESKPAKDFHRRLASPDGLQTKCTLCRKEEHRKSRPVKKDTIELNWWQEAYEVRRICN